MGIDIQDGVFIEISGLVDRRIPKFNQQRVGIGKVSNFHGAYLLSKRAFESHPRWQFTAAIISITPMQLDIFEHSRDVVLRNAVIDALGKRDTGVCAQTVAALAAE